ncbi:MAG: phenylalanine--tRNA ligase subunit beta, partial [Candidatus Omnitrophota bacterium]
MKLSYDWLKDYVRLTATPEEIAEKLTMSGSEVEAVHQVGQDRVMDLEITSNRPDCLSIMGLAREISALYDINLRPPHLALFSGTTTEKAPKVQCVIKSATLCPRYTARVITGVQVTESSKQIMDRITAVDLRPVNNIVDITNYCLIELGQPLHAFDLDKIKGDKIFIREAVKGERIATIDGNIRDLEPGMLVITDSERPIAIAGIMGGVDTEVGESTRNILLESAYFNPASIRQTARRLGLSSESSYRFERGVDKGMIERTSDRASTLIAKETNGKVCGFFEAGNLPIGKSSIRFNIEKAGKILGAPVDGKRVRRVFGKLGINIEQDEGNKLLVQPPPFREDLRREIDLIEEMARIVGYDNVPETTTRLLFQAKRKGHSRLVEEKIRNTLSALGLDEIMTYSLISAPAAARFAAVAKGNTVQLKNPLSEEQKIMTSQLLDGMLRAISYNVNRSNKDLRLAEIGKIYAQEGKTFSEVPVLCIGMTGLARKSWQEAEKENDFYELKGAVETLFSGLRLEAEFNAKEIEGLEACAAVNIKGENAPVGFLGKVSSRILREYDIKQPVCVCQIELASLYDKTDLEYHYKSITRFPSSSRDVSILCDKPIAAGEIFKTIAEADEKMIRDVKLVDTYEGDKISADKK